MIPGNFAGVSLRMTLGKGSMAATEQLVDEARAAAGGDLTVQPEVWFANEYGELQAGFARMVGAFRQTRVRMQKAEDLTACGGGTGVHLPGAAACGSQYPVGSAARKFHCAVIAAAVDDDDLRAAPPQRLQAVERRRDMFGFIECGDDDGQ